MLVFPNQPGQVIALSTSEAPVGLPLAFDGIQGSWFPSFGAILTGVSVAMNGNAQFSPTLRDVNYVYAFGDQISQLQVSGLALASGCVGIGNLTTPFGTTLATSLGGFERVLAYYKLNRIAVRQTPIQVQIGISAAGSFRGYLMGFTGAVLQAESRIAEFTLGLKVF